MQATRTSAKIGLALAAVAVLAAGCLRTEEFPKEPIITFKSLDVHGDSASLTISFTDGDGDIGLGQGDTLAPYNPGSQWFYNFFVDYFELVDGEWVERTFAVPLYYRIPVITSTGQNKALEGDIAVALVWPVMPGPAGTSRTVRFDVRLADRAQHMSGRVSSSPVVVQF